jgi:hypothetical protein
MCELESEIIVTGAKLKEDWASIQRERTTVAGES